MKIRNLAILALICCLTSVTSIIAASQDGQTRSITSDDFASQRPARSRSTAKKPVRKKPKTYRFVRVDKSVAGLKTAQSRPAQAAVKRPVKVTEIGVTMWKLRPPGPGETGLLLLPVRDDKGERRLWLAERVPTDTLFNVGDKVRFAVESSISGYLYVFDREIYSDGTFGEPALTFPESPSDDNSLGPGMLFDIPDHRDEWPYLSMKPNKPNYVGELLTVVISPTPWASIRVNTHHYVENTDELIRIESGADVEIFTRTDTSDKFFSTAESESSCGVKTRQLEREKAPGTPCGTASRQLTRDESLPQSIYRVNGVAGQPAVAFVRLAVRN